MSIARTNARDRGALFILLRALRSTIAVGAVALVVNEIRAGRWRWADVIFLLAAYWPYLVAVFFALSIWDYWFWRTRRGHCIGGNSPDE